MERADTGGEIEVECFLRNPDSLELGTFAPWNWRRGEAEKIKIRDDNDQHNRLEMERSGIACPS